MKRHPNFLVYIALAFLLLIDIYAFNGLQVLTSYLEDTLATTALHMLYFLFTGAVLFSIFYLTRNYKNHYAPKYMRHVSRLTGVVILTTIPKVFFIFFHGIGDIGYFLTAAINSTALLSLDISAVSKGAGILTKAGIAAAVIPFISISYGIAKGRYNYKVMKEVLAFKNLPAAFDGLKIVHISDIHIGSFHDNHEVVEKAINKINKLQPDVIFFTGDIVNNYARELDGWEKTFSNLTAKYGKYSVLGNHDYGDYGFWNSITAKEENLRQIKEFHKKIGFQLLLNESTTVEINGENIDVLGVENWGLPPFKQYGNLNKTIESSTKAAFQVLLSHDPSHWDAEIIEKTKIDLTLAGHTHGAQFGVGIGKKKWSPIKKKYPRWAGLYREKEQYLYVNRGFGFHAFPGRVGMPPELTFIELKNESIQ